MTECPSGRQPSLRSPCRAGPHEYVGLLMPTALGKQAYGICGKQGESVVMADINGQMYVNTLMYECTYMYECINNMY